MIDMSVEICGVHFKNPIIAASGTFGFGEEFARFYDIGLLGGISVKGLTLEPRQGNPAVRIAETAGGLLNAVGLQNPGVDAFLQEELPRLKQKNVVIIANIAGSTLDDYARIARKLRGSGVDIIELNISCPNVTKGGMQFGVRPESVEQVTRIVKEQCDRPLMVKLSPNVADITQNALAAQAGGADALSLINTLSGMAVDAFSRRPILGNIIGGLSGSAIKPVALRMVYQVTQAVTIPVIGMGGILTGIDAAEFMLCGAAAVMVGTANLMDPMACLHILEGLRDFLKQQGIKTARELTGALLCERGKSL